jgi:hypothetical protein
MTLNMIFVNSTGLPDDQVFITFQDPGNTLVATHSGGKAVSRGFVVDKKTKVKTYDMMTESLNLTTIGKGGLDLENAQGPVVFISYQAKKATEGFDMDADLSGPEQPSYIGPSGANHFKAYQPFEITCIKGETGGQGNLTNINYFGAPISIESFNGGASGTSLEARGYYKKTATGTDKLTSKLAELTTGKNSALATITYKGKTLRAIGPSSYGVGTNPYPTFDAYLDWIHSQKKLVTTIQNSNAFNTTENPSDKNNKPLNINYNYELDFVATVAADRTITLTGDIKTTIIKFGESAKAGKTYKGAVVTISPTTPAGQTNAATFNNTIYGQADPLKSGEGSTTFNKVWDDLKADMKAQNLFSNMHDVPGCDPTTYQTTQSLAVGEITTGLLGGFVGSKVVYTGGTGAFTTYNGKAYKDVPSAAWWHATSVPAPSVLQPTDEYYSGYSKVIFDATDNEVYSIPFSDRFGQGPLMQTQLYDNQVVNTWVVTLGKPVFMS